MNRINIEAFICQNLAEYDGLDRKVLPQEKLADLNLDSLDMIEISMEYEDKYKIELNDDEVSGCKTVDDIVTLIHKKVSDVATG